MSQALKEKGSELYQGKVKNFTIFTHNGIKITLDLPNLLIINQNRQEYYPTLDDTSNIITAPFLVNNSGFDIQSATFSVTLNDLISTGNVIANARWFSLSNRDLPQTLDFKCGPVKNGEQVKSTTVKDDGYSRIRWATMANNGAGTTTFSNSVNLISLTFGPVTSDPNKPANGPDVQIG